MIDRAGAECTVAVVDGLIAGIINQQTHSVPRKIAVGKIVVASVVDAAVVAVLHNAIGYSVKFAVIRNIDTRVATGNLAVRNEQMGLPVNTRPGACDAAARERRNLTLMNTTAVVGSSGGAAGTLCSLKENAVTCPDCGRKCNCRRPARNSHVFDGRI